MSPVLLPLLVALPIVAAALCVLLRDRPRVTTALVTGTSLAVLAAGGSLLAVTMTDGPVAHPVGLWPTGIAIPFVVDPFSAVLVTVVALLVTMIAVFAAAMDDTRHPLFAALVLALSAGVYGALLTGDLFNLYVFFELMLVPSYALMALLGARRSLGATRLFVVVNVFASLALLLGVALVYGTAGTVNLAELHGAAQDSPTVAVAAGVVLVALGLKASLVPMHGWLMQTYPFTSPAVSALFTVLHTKVAVYAIYRIYAVVFGGSEQYLGVLLAVMVATMVVGALASLGATTMRSALAMQVVSHVGFILLGVALFGPLGLAAGIFYLVHNMVVKGALFLAAGAVENAYGTGRLDRLSGLVRTEALVAVVFLAAGFSLSGMPPFSGFAAKVLLVGAAVDQGQFVAVVAVVLASLLSLLVMVRLWDGVFWGRTRAEPEEVVHQPVRSLTRVKPWAAVPALLLTVVSLALGIGAQGLVVVSTAAAEHLVDPTRYVQAVRDA